MTFDYSYLRGFIKEYFKSNLNFADFLGIGTTSLYCKLNGQSQFTQKEISKVIFESRPEILDSNEVIKLFFYPKNT